MLGGVTSASSRLDVLFRHEKINEWCACFIYYNYYLRENQWVSKPHDMLEAYSKRDIHGCLYSTMIKWALQNMLMQGSTCVLRGHCTHHSRCDKRCLYAMIYSSPLNYCLDLIWGKESTWWRRLHIVLLPKENMCRRWVHDHVIVFFNVDLMVHFLYLLFWKPLKLEGMTLHCIQLWVFKFWNCWILYPCQSIS